MYIIVGFNNKTVVTLIGHKLIMPLAA